MSLPDVVSREERLEARHRLLAQEKMFHTYSVYGRGTEYAGNTYAFLDMTAPGRQEDWEEPKGRVAPVRGGDPTFTS